MTLACPTRPRQRSLWIIILVLCVAGFSLLIHVASISKEDLAPSQLLVKPAQAVQAPPTMLRQSEGKFVSGQNQMADSATPVGVDTAAAAIARNSRQRRSAPPGGQPGAAPAQAVPQRQQRDAPQHIPLSSMKSPQQAAAPVQPPTAAPATQTVSKLHHGKPSTTCLSHFDFDMLHQWNKLNAPFCKPVHSGAAGSKDASSLQCRVTVDGHLPGPTAPHTICDGENIVLDWDKMGPTNCVAHRPGYMCDGPAIWWEYGPGAVGGMCETTPPFRPTAFPKDHLRAMFSSWASSPLPPPRSAGAPDTPPVTVLVTRERGEHANWFHSTTDILNAYLALHVTGVIDAKLDGGTYADDVAWYTPPAAGSGGGGGGGPWWQSPATAGRCSGGGDGGIAHIRATIQRNVGVLIMDSQHEGPFDPLWSLLYAPKHGMQRSHALQATGGKLLLPRAVFSPPGYTSFLLSHLTQDADCVQATHLMRSFSRFVLSSLGFQHLMPQPTAGTNPPILITVVSRRPYVKGAVDHKTVGRQIDNEPELVAALEAAGRAASVDVHAELVDFAHLSITQQIELVAHSDILVGMHGAALTHVPYLPPWGGALELWPKAADMWRCFEHLARWSGVHYSRWANRHPAAFRRDAGGDYTRVHPEEVQEMAQGLLHAVVGRRKAWAAGAAQV